MSPRVWLRCAAVAVALAVGLGVVPTATAKPAVGIGTAAAGTAAGGIAIPGYRLAEASQGQLARDLDRVRGTGAKWLRTDIVWGDIEYVKGRYDWSYADRIVKTARARDLRILGIVTGLPSWARPKGTKWNHGPTTSAQREAFARFAKIAARRYAGKITAWEVWNEPNLKAFWAPTPNAGKYASLLRQVYPAIKAGSPSATVLSGGTGWASERKDIASTTWYKQLYAKKVRTFFDAAAVHPYFAFSDSMSGEMRRALTVRDVMDRNKDGKKPIWGTEVGAPTGGAISVSEAAQAALVTAAYREWTRVHHRGPLFWYTLNDTAGGDREAHFGLVTRNGRLKPSYHRLRAQLS